MMMNRGFCFGVFLGLLGTLLGSFSKIFLKLAHNVSKDDPALSRLYWVAGVVAIAFNPPMSLISLRYTPESVFAATGGTAALFNLALAPWLLNEQFTDQDVYAAVAIALGCLGLAWSEADAIASPDVSYQQLSSRFVTPEFLFFSVATLAFSAVMCAMILKVCGDIWHKRAIGALAGIIGGMFFFTKAFITCLSLPEPWSHAITYKVGIFSLLSAVGGIVVMNEGLRRYDAVFIAPVYQAFLVLMGAASGEAFFGDFRRLQATNRMIACLSVLVMCGGIVCSMSGESTGHEKGTGDDASVNDSKGSSAQECGTVSNGSASSMAVLDTGASTQGSPRTPCVCAETPLTADIRPKRMRLPL